MQTAYSRVGPSSAVDTVASYEKLAKGITTRVMAKKIMKQKERENSFWGKEGLLAAYSGRSITETSRQPSKFLSGAAIPNSIIKGEALAASAAKKPDDKNAIREQRDASVREIIKRIESRLTPDPSTLIPVNENEAQDSANDDLIENRRLKKNYGRRASIAQDIPEKVDPQKEQQRILRRTQTLQPLSNHRTPTYESIKSAIQNSETHSQIVDVDNMDNSLKMLHEAVNREPSFVTRIPSLGGASSPPQTLASLPKVESLEKITSKTSRHSKGSKTSQTMRKSKTQLKRRKSILKRGSRDASKPLRSVSIVENTKEDTQTQTYLNMKDFSAKIKEIDKQIGNIIV